MNKSEIAEKYAQKIFNFRTMASIRDIQEIVERAIAESQAPQPLEEKPSDYEDMKVSVACAIDQEFGIDRQFSAYLNHMVAEGFIEHVDMLRLTKSGESLLPNRPKGNENV